MRLRIWIGLLPALYCSPCAAQVRDARKDAEGAVENILNITRGEGVEIHSYAFNRILEKQLPITQKVLHENLTALKEEALHAVKWLPEHLAMSNTPSGYGSSALAVSFRLSGQDIALAAFAAQPPPARKDAQEILERIYRRTSVQPSCDAPWFDTNLPLMAFLGERLKSYYPAVAEQLTLIDRLGSSVDSPFDLVPLLRLAERSEIKAPEEIAFLVARTAEILDRLAPPVKGASVLTESFDLDSCVRALVARGNAVKIDTEPLLAAYRRYVVRTMGQAMCYSPDRTADRRELAARQKMLENFNRLAASSSSAASPPISEAELKRALGRPSGIEPSFDPPSELRQLQLKVRRRPAGSIEELDTLSEYLNQWSKWHPKGENDDARWVDSKVTMLLGLLPYASESDRKKIAPVAVSYLSRHWTKQRHPDLWLSYVAVLLSLGRGFQAGSSVLPPDPGLIAEIQRANDHAIAALARIEVLKYQGLR